MGGRVKKKAKIRDQDSFQGSEHLGQSLAQLLALRMTQQGMWVLFVIQIGVELRFREKQ